MQPTSSKSETRLAAALARLDQQVDWERRSRARMRVSVEPERDLLARLGSPQAGLPAVHVAGSKGKGSVAALVAAGLGRAGLRTGLYTSPHVERVNERVAIGGEPLADALLAEALERALATREAAVAAGSAGAEATWFDIFTAAAFWAFRRAEVDWLVVECGLGGRLDSTNVLGAEVCVVTTIELEHTAVLGSTRSEIALEKAGILSRGCTLVTGVPPDDEAGRALDRRAEELGVRVLRPGWLGGERPAVADCNRALAELVLAELGRRGRTDATGRALGPHLLDALALEHARLSARMERFEVRGVPLVLDGAHTPNSARDVLRDLARDPGLRGRPIAVVGMAREKDLTGILKALAAHVDRLVCTSTGSELHRAPGEIAGAAADLGMAAETAASPGMALDRALQLACEGRGWVLVLGSLWLAGAIRPLLPSTTRASGC
jgi:dihydrofolate synthase/folylpolyglutamate synthase